MKKLNLTEATCLALEGKLDNFNTEKEINLDNNKELCLLLAKRLEGIDILNPNKDEKDDIKETIQSVYEDNPFRTSYTDAPTISQLNKCLRILKTYLKNGVDNEYTKYLKSPFVKDDNYPYTVNIQDDDSDGRRTLDYGEFIDIFDPYSNLSDDELKDLYKYHKDTRYTEEEIEELRKEMDDINENN